MRRALDHRDQGCRFPGCTCSPRFTDAHHIDHWADGGETKLANLTLLCRYHHRLVHEGGFSLEQRNGQLVFTRPDGREIPPVPEPITLEHPGAETLQRNHAQAGLAIDARTGVPGWGGETADYTYLLTMLDQREFVGPLAHGGVLLNRRCLRSAHHIRIRTTVGLRRLDTARHRIREREARP
jgi:hypothetical protein